VSGWAWNDRPEPEPPLLSAGPDLVVLAERRGVNRELVTDVYCSRCQVAGDARAAFDAGYVHSLEGCRDTDMHFRERRGVPATTEEPKNGPLPPGAVLHASLEEAGAYVFGTIPQPVTAQERLEAAWAALEASDGT
jgi:hypothetical protein